MIVPFLLNRAASTVLTHPFKPKHLPPPFPKKISLLTSSIFIQPFLLGLSLFFTLGLSIHNPKSLFRLRLQMSHILEKSPKHCAKKGFNINKKLLYSVTTSCTTLLLFILLIYLILHPTKPEFTLTEADIYQLNLSGPPHLLNSSIQVTFRSKNPNQKVGIYYDELRAYASYKGQQITVHSLIPAFYQGNQDIDLLSASLVGMGMPVASSVGYEVGRDQTRDRRLVISFKVDGGVRWKIGTWVSGKYPLNVNCIAVLAFPYGPGISPAGSSPNPIGVKQGTRCETTV